MKRRYDIGLNSRMPFIKTQAYLEENFGEGRDIGEEEIEEGVSVPVTEYTSHPNSKVRLIGDTLVDKRFLEIEGNPKDIFRILRDLKEKQVKIKSLE